METWIYRKIDDVELPADVHRRAAGTSGPTLLWIHGGALIAGSRKEIPQDVISWLCARGFTVILVDYRLAPGTNIRGILDDLQCAYHAVRTEGVRRFDVDADRVVVVGQSAGGFLSLLLATSTEPKPRAVVSWYGYGRINGRWSNSLPGSTRRIPRVGRWKELLLSSRIPQRLQGHGRLYYGALARYSGVWTPTVIGDACNPLDEEAVRAFNPEDRVAPGFPPTLLIHGDRDTDVPLGEALRMDAVLTQHHVPHELMIVNRPHGFDLGGLKDDLVTTCLTRMVAFLQTHAV